jgi:hypothetical protein
MQIAACLRFDREGAETGVSLVRTDVRTERSHRVVEVRRRQRCSGAVEVAHERGQDHAQFAGGLAGFEAVCWDRLVGDRCLLNGGPSWVDWPA